MFYKSKNKETKKKPKNTTFEIANTTSVGTASNKLDFF